MFLVFCKRFQQYFLILISGAFEVNQMVLQGNHVAGGHNDLFWTDIEQRFSTSKVFLTGLCQAACSVGDGSGAEWCSSQCVHSSGCKGKSQVKQLVSTGC